MQKKGAKLVTSVQREPRDDHIYYNVNLYNTSTTEHIPAQFSEVRSAPIVKDPSEYHISIIRFSVPGDSIPIFNFVDGAYTVTLSYSNTDFTQPVIYVPNNTVDANSRRVFSYQSFLNMINTAFATAFTALKTAFPAAPPTVAPFIIFDPTTELFSYIAQDQYDPDIAGAATIEVYMNSTLFQFFETFPAIFNGWGIDKSFQLLAQDVHNNLGSFPGFPPVMGVTYLQMSQQAISTGLFNDMQALVFTTQNIPVKAEYLPNSTSQGTTSTNNTQSILTDFEPDRSGTAPSPSTSFVFQYFPQGPYRMLDLLGNIPLQTLDVQVFWRDRKQQLFPVFINPGDVLTVKMLFQKKGVKDYGLGPY